MDSHTISQISIPLFTGSSQAEICPQFLAENLGD
jgi:hypothetical protein